MVPSLKLTHACLAALWFMAACTTINKPVENPRRVWCDFNQPRRDATPETPRAELDEINSHNFTGQQWCGWKA